MRVRLLGPVDLVDDPPPQSVVGLRRKSVLAVLALHAGQLVTIELLVNGVWGEDPPATAVNTLQSHISHLRRLLVAGGLTTHGRAGYSLSLPGHTTDLQAFAHRVARAREATDPRAAVVELQAALALVEGEPLADVREVEYLSRHAARLDEDILAAQVYLARVLLESGRATEAMSLTTAPAGRHPYAEALHEQRIRALYATGHQVDALATYHALRARLDDELGIAPGPRLKQLKIALLRQDDSLMAPDPDRPEKPISLTAPPPIPRLNGVVVHRNDAIKTLIDLLERFDVVTVTGPGGVGKSHLCQAVVPDLRARFGDRVFWADLADVPADAVVRAVAESAGMVWEGPDRAIEALGALAESGACLLVLDSCERVVCEVARLVSQLRLADNRPVLLTTSQERLRITGEGVLALQPLSLPPEHASLDTLPSYESVQLLADLMVVANPAFVVSPSSLPLLAHVCHRLDGLPLALALAAAQLRSMTLTELVEGLDDRFALLHSGDNRLAAARHQSLAATVAWSHDLLTPAEATFFRRFATFHGGARLALARAVCGPDDAPRFHQAVSALVDKSLLVHITSGERSRLTMHQTVAAYALTRLERHHECSQLRAAHAVAYEGLTLEEARRFHSRDEGAALARLTEDAGNIRAAMDWAVENRPAMARSMGSRLWWWWFRTGRSQDGRDRLRQACAAPIDAAEADETVFAALAGLGYLTWVCDDYEQALELADRVIDAPGLGPSTLGLAYGVRARALGELGRFHDAHLAAAAGVEAFMRADDPWAVAWSRRCDASALVLDGDLKTALTVATNALHAFEVLNDAWGAAGAFDLLASINDRRGETGQALDLSDRAVAAYRALGDTIALRMALQHRAAAARSAGHVATALASAEEALDLSRRHGYRVGVLQALLLLADLLDGPDAAVRAAEAEIVGRRLGPASAVSRELEREARARSEASDCQ